MTETVALIYRGMQGDRDILPADLVELTDLLETRP
jgi:hypothetical protein